MIKLFLFAFFSLSDFSHVNAVQFIEGNVCVATDGGVFVYREGEGIVLSYPFPYVKLAFYDPDTKTVAFITKDHVLYVYSSFFNTLKKVGIKKHVSRLGLKAGIIHLVYDNGKQDYITIFNQKSEVVYIDPMIEAKNNPIPLYVKTRVFENPCHVFSAPTSYVQGFTYDVVGTNKSGIFIFDRATRLLKNNIFINIVPPIYKIKTLNDTLYILHSHGITKIKSDYVNSLSKDCFPYEFLPVDLIDIKQNTILVSKTGYYILKDPYFFTSLPEECSFAINAFHIEDKTFITTRHCLLYVDKAPWKIYYTPFNIDYAAQTGHIMYILIDEKLYTKEDTIKKEIDYQKEPIIAHYIIEGKDRLYIPAKRGLFIIDGKDITLIRSPYNLLSCTSGIIDENKLYMALWDKVVSYDFKNDAWSYVNLDKNNIYEITALGIYGHRLYIGYRDGVLVK